MRKLNKALLRRLARKLRRLRHEEHYDQSSWHIKTQCGTAACIAGHAVIEAGYRILPADDPFDIPLCSIEGGPPVPIDEAAQELLGLDHLLSPDLFSEVPMWDWPEEFAERWKRADPKGPAPQRPSRVAADLLDALADGKVEPF